MEELKLYESPVVFYDDNAEDKSKRHTYWLGDKQLQGITSTLLVKALGDPYEGWTGQSAINLQNAASRGHRIHADIETACVHKTEPETVEGKKFFEFLKKNNWTVVANEYTVSDEEAYASKIDLLILDEHGEMCIADIKTYSAETAKQQLLRVALQCGIYNYMFRLHNDIEVCNHYEVRLRNGECQVMQLPMVDNSVVKELFEACKTDDKKYKYNPTPAWYYTLEDDLDGLMAIKERVENEIAAIKEYMMEQMKAENYSTIKNRYTASVCKGRTTSKVDEKKFCEEHPEIAVDFLEQTFDTKAFVKASKKELMYKDYITETTGEDTLRLVNNNKE